MKRHLIHQAAGFRAKALTGLPFAKKADTGLTSLMETSYEARFDLIGQRDGLIDFISRDDSLSAVLTLHSDHESILGAPFTHLSIDCEDSPDGWRDVATLIYRNATLFTDDVTCFAMASAAPLREILLSAGFDIEWIDLMGTIDEGLARLVSEVQPRAEFKDFGLDARKIQNAAEIDAALGIFASEFERTPKYCPWAGRPEYIHGLAHIMNGLLKDNKLEVSLLCRDDTILGYFGFYPVPDGLLFPSSASVEIILDESIQGMGVAKTCYLKMLTEMKQKGIEIFRGGTAHPAILGMAKKMNRKPATYLMRLSSSS